MGKQWGELNSDEQAQVLDLTNSTRGYAQLLAKLANLGQAIAAAYNGGTSTIVNSLDGSAVIPNTTGLSGAQPLAPADVTNMVGYAINLSDSTNNTPSGGYNTPYHRALEVKMVGIVNTSGQ